MLVGCGDNSSMRKIYQGSLATILKKSPEINYDQLARKIPYANIIVQRNGHEAILVLAYSIGPELQWVSSDHAMLITQHGILKRTFGLKNNLNDLRYLKGFNPYQQSLAAIHSNQSAQGILSLTPQKLYALPFKAEFIPMGKRTILTADGLKKTIKIKEWVSVSTIDWRYTNCFWIMPNTGQVIKSVQYFSPHQAPLSIEVVKTFVKGDK